MDAYICKECRIYLCSVLNINLIPHRILTIKLCHIHCLQYILKKSNSRGFLIRTCIGLGTEIQSHYTAFICVFIDSIWCCYRIANVAIETSISCLPAPLIRGNPYLKDPLVLGESWQLKGRKTWAKTSIKMFWLTANISIYKYTWMWLYLKHLELHVKLLKVTSLEISFL